MSSTPSLRAHFLAYCNAANGIAISATLIRNVDLVLLDTIDAGIPNDAYLARQARAIHGYINALIPTIGNTQAIQDLYNAYAETRTYLRLQRHYPNVTPIPPQPRKQTPDFSISLHQGSIYLEYKSLNGVGGTAAHNNQLQQNLNANIALQGQTGPVRTTTTVLQPYHATGFHYDPRSTKMVIETITTKIQGNLAPGQFAFGPTILLVDLAELPLASVPQDALDPTYTDGTTGHPISGELYHIAWGTLGTTIFKPFNGITDFDGPLGTEGILRVHPFVAGIIFLFDEDWLGAIDGAAQPAHLVTLVQALTAKTRTSP
jgi:hypothetical protein